VNNKKRHKWCNFLSYFLFNSTYGLPVLTIDTSYPNHVFYFDWSNNNLFVINRVRKPFSSPNNDIRICLLDMRHSWITNAFWDVNNMKWRKWCKFVPPFLFNDTYGLPVLTIESKCPNQEFYHWLVLNMGWKRDSFQIMIFACLFDLKHSWS
jgi:hypothetical protein